jgi:phenylacetic acid degradation operon negative regulatory protein
MKPKTQELLYRLLWVGDMAARPTFRNLTDSFEAWAYRNGFQRQLAALEQQQLIETKQEPAGGRLHRLTEAGRLAVLGPRDSFARWKRRWDGKWRMVLFDVPQHRASERVRLRRSLAERGFGYLQNSVWITPDPLTGEREALGNDEVDVESLILLEASPCAGERNEDIVAGAWDFEAISDRYERHGRILDRFPRHPAAGETAKEWHRWLREERLAWNEVMRLDPLLPECLHPNGYPGVKAYRRRLDILAEAGQQLRAFRRVA